MHQKETNSLIAWTVEFHNSFLRNIPVTKAIFDKLGLRLDNPVKTGFNLQDLLVNQTVFRG
jgi:hypothetical protein